jgi:cytochrome c
VEPPTVRIERREPVRVEWPESKEREVNRAIVYGLFASISVPLFAGAALQARAAGPGGDSGNVQQQMAKQGCTACHAVDSKLVGPAFGWIAYRYQDVARDKAVTEVADFIIKGGTGYWEPWVGSLPMPSHSAMSQTEAETLARWILSLQPVEPPAKPGQ